MRLHRHFSTALHTTLSSTATVCIQRGADAARSGAHSSMASAGLRMAPQQYAEAAPSVVSRVAGAAAGAELGSAKAPLYVTQVCNAKIATILRRILSTTTMACLKAIRGLRRL